MRGSAKKMFIRGLIQSFFIVSLLFGMGALGYQTTMHFWKASDEEVVVAYKEQPVPERITIASIDDISKNLIFCYNEETGEISKVVLEIFHCENKQLSYVTIPLRTQFTMPDYLYRRLIVIHPAIPQVIKLSAMTKYLDLEIAFDYIVLVVEDLLAIEISYYTAISQDTYDTIFMEDYKTTEDNGSEEDKVQLAEQTLPIEIFSEEYKEFLQTIQTAEELSNYIEEMYQSVKSNLSLFDKMNYLDSYCKTPMNNISFYLIKGQDHNSAFVIDQDLAAQQLRELQR